MVPVGEDHPLGREERIPSLGTSTSSSIRISYQLSEYSLDEQSRAGFVPEISAGGSHLSGRADPRPRAG